VSNTTEFYPSKQKQKLETETVSKVETVSVSVILYSGAVRQTESGEYKLLVATDFSGAWWVPADAAPESSLPTLVKIASDAIPCYNLSDELTSEAIENFLNNLRLNFWLAGGITKEDLQVRAVKQQVGSTRFVMSKEEQ